jgi:hypothetical protein
MTNPEPIVLELSDGSRLTAMMHVESGKLHLDLGWIGTFVIEPMSARNICGRILHLLDKCVHTNE